jgi:hypothetical protein
MGPEEIVTPGAQYEAKAAFCAPYFTGLTSFWMNPPPD